MTDEEWVKFFSICAENMGHSSPLSYDSENWCSFLTFSSLKYGGKYFCAGLPRRNEILEKSIMDGGIWREPEIYQNIAHIIIPRSFYWETPDHTTNKGFEHGLKEQNIDKLSDLLDAAGIVHGRCKRTSVVETFFNTTNQSDIMALDIKLF